MEVPYYLKIFFYLLVGIGFTLLMSMFKTGILTGKIDREKGAALQGKVILILLAWVAVLIITSYFGFFANFDALPPRPFFIIILSILGIVILAKNKTYRQILNGIPPEKLLYFQAFRIPLEIWLWLLFIEYIIPVQMTFEGYNFDVVSAILGPVVGYLVFVKKVAPIWLAKAYNYLGILTVIIIVSIAALSMPTPLRQFSNEPANTLIAYFPYVLLPGILVPLALLLHISSLLQLKSYSKSAQ